MATFKEEVYYDGMIKIAVRNSTPQAKQEFNKDVNNEVVSLLSMPIGSGRRYNKAIGGIEL